MSVPLCKVSFIYNNVVPSVIDYVDAVLFTNALQIFLCFLCYSITVQNELPSLVDYINDIKQTLHVSASIRVKLNNSEQIYLKSYNIKSNSNIPSITSQKAM